MPWRRIATIAASFLVVVAGISYSVTERTPLALVSLDVNPGIELTINSKERVINANPINDEAQDILAEMDLKGSDIDVACNAIVGSMLTHGYLTDLSNSVLLSVNADDEQVGTEIEKRLSKHVNDYLETTEIALAAALKKVGLNKSDVTNIKYEFDVERGVLIYEVSFRAGDYEYDYDINAYNGKVVSSEKEYEPIYTLLRAADRGSSSKERRHRL